MNQYIQGGFCAALIICLLMMAFPKERTCAVKISHGNGNISHVNVGVWNE